MTRSSTSLFASETIGALRGIDPESGHYFADPKRDIEATANHSEAERFMVYAGNTRRVFPRLGRALKRRPAPGLSDRSSALASGVASQSSGVAMQLPMNQLGIVNSTAPHRTDKAAVEQLSKLGVATIIHEAIGRVGLLKPYRRPAYRGAKLCGTTVTLLLQPGDNSGCCMWRPSNCSRAMWGWLRARRTASTRSLATCWPRPSRRAVPRG